MTVQFNAEGFALKSGEVTVYVVDSQGIYHHSENEYVSIGAGLSAGAFLDAPLQDKAGFAIIRTDKGWEYIADHRGKICYDKSTRTETIISKLGEIPQNLTALKPDSEYDMWNEDAGCWEVSQEKLTALLTDRKTALLQHIADKTDQLKAQYLLGYSQAEIDSFYRQEREARGELPLMLLTELFEGRDDLVNIEQLKEKVIEKADLFAIIMGKTFAVKQNFETHIEQAQTLEELENISKEIDKWQSI
ncbi:tail fiber assembly protein [Rodentibacter myodis]|uniref:tail fiber assembly protein n=1 Tax=Rodentibacter myodis TaxID=1907939 RepID=UPI001ABF8327|nr:tail fiber assembly protein [Rodentibacter myodis]